MAKGFGTKPDRPLGYVLNLMPKFHAYAGKFSLDFRGEPGRFIGIVSDLEDAQVWKKQKEARDAILKYYLDCLADQLQESSEVNVTIQRLRRSEGGKLTTEPVETLVFSAAELNQ
ncbi:hypothetical protein IQ273_18455 [Nodosilinea sp. LEGE 07298]|uniref:hypothetical protein n=1 Tax=Nodosilinea sp. LEGE 07298 TaxID=2777970 RepID=UPI00187DF9EE|nr:hypothetical protein [Nodosilinea sp. LEGE 07298]MBE9111390.1 hypothetical protein [Nodosilinea sp. LEGE 07298]